MIKKVLNKRNSGRHEWKHQKKVTRTPNNLYPSRREVGATYLEKTRQVSGNEGYHGASFASDSGSVISGICGKYSKRCFKYMYGFSELAFAVSTRL